MVLMPLGFFIVLTILRATMQTADFVARLNNITWLLWFFIISVLNNVSQNMYEKKLLYLLPTSKRTKFFMPMGIAFLTIVAISLLTIPIEAIAHIFTIGNMVEQQVAIGGFLKYSFKNNSMIFIPIVFACASTFVHSLVRNNLVIGLILGPLIMATFLFTPVFYDYLLSPRALSTNAIIGCLASSVLLIAVSYQLFKRWQPANSGIFRV
jgi:hypothetical protein